MKRYVLSILALFLFLSSNAQCPNLSTGKKVMASSFHSSVIITHDSLVRYWGDAASQSLTAGSATNVLDPLTLTGYTGVPLSVAAGSSGSSDHQLYLHTSTNIYGWGYSNSTIVGGTTGDVALSSIALPSGVSIAQVAFIEAAGGGLALVTNSGAVYMKKGASGTPLIYGDGTTASFNTAWHKVKTSSAAADTLTGVTRLSVSSRAVMALTLSGNVYVWGNNVFLGSGSGATDYSYATLVTKPSGVTPVDINVNSLLNYSSSMANAVEFILGLDGKLYGVGENYHGVLGQGNETDVTSWVTVKGPGGTGTLDNIIQIGSSNPYPLGYGVGAITSAGKLYLWGDNNYDMLGGDSTSSPSTDSTFYTVPRVPPNFNYNGASIGYFEMGGHTTAAFLSGTNKFCYIGHKIRGSMGDGVSTTGTRKSFDCINTPDEFICPPAVAVGCPLPNASDLIASSSHATLVVNGQPSVTYWGEAASSAEPGISMSAAKVLYEYSGDAIGVAASSVSVATSSQSTQMWLHTNQGIWGWGYSANTIRVDRINSVAMTQIALPGGVAASDISFIRSARGGLALVTTSGNVWVRAGASSACSPRIYGDASSSLDVAGSTVWHQVTTAVATPLSNVTELSFAGTAAIAITSSGTAYVWGDNTYLGDGTAAANRNRAALMTLHADFTGSIVPRTAEIIQSGSLEAAQFILGSNNRIYSLGRNANGVLGTGSSTFTAISTSWNSLSLSGVRKLSSNNPFADGFYSIGALTLTGNMYLWGANTNGMLGFPLATTNVTSPTVATTLAANDATNFEMSGYHTIIFARSTSSFYFAGRSRGGSRADGSSDANYTPFVISGSVPNCANSVFTIAGHLYNDNNGVKNNLVDGTAISTVRTTAMHANLLDASGYVLATTPISGGAYSFSNYPVSNYFVQISPTAGTLFDPAPTTALPTNWVFSGEQNGTTAGVGIDTGTANGMIAVALAANLTDVNFGVQQKPSAVSDTMSLAYNPGGTKTISIANGFTGIDTLGTIDSIKITAFPSNVTSLTVGSNSYTSGTFPVAGITYAVSGTSVGIDPIDGSLMSVIPFYVIDNAGYSSPGTANLFVPVVTVPPIANNISSARINSSAAATSIPQLQASSPIGVAIQTYQVLSLPSASEGVLYYCAAAPSTCAIAALSPVSTLSTLTPAQAASLYFDPAQTYTGTLNFTYKATDSNGYESNVANYSIPVYNNPPTTQNVRMAEITSTNGPSKLSNLIGADADGTVDSFIVSSIPSSAQGILSYCSNGTDTCTGTVLTISSTTTLSPAQMTTLKLDPDSAYTGDYVFNYQAKDNNGNLSNTSTFTVPLVASVSGGNLPPVATNIIAQNINNSLGATPIPNLLGTDPDGSVVTYTIGSSIPNALSEGLLYYCVSPGASCALTAVTASQTMTPAQAATLQFDPLASFIGTATFDYTVTDNLGAQSASANYQIPVVNTPPVANPVSVNPILNTTVTPTLLPPLSGNDADGTITTYNITSVPAASDGTLQYCVSPGAACALSTISGPVSGMTPAQAATLNFIPNSSFTGNYVFNFTSVDNNSLVSVAATFTIPVVAVATSTDEPPVAYSYNASAINSASTADLSAALSGTDPDGSIANYTITSIPAANHGALSYCTTPPSTGCGTAVSPGLILSTAQAATLLFTPNADFIGTATFNYTTKDNDSNISNTATVTVPVMNNPPVSSNINNASISRYAGATTVSSLSSADQDGTIASYTILSVPGEDQGVLSLCTTAPSTGCTPVTVGQVLTPAQIANLSFTPDTSTHSPVVAFLYSATDNSNLISNVASVNIPMADAAPLPLELLSFTLTKYNNNALVNWTAADESLTASYQLMHSVDGAIWNTIYQQTPYHLESLNEYQYVDENLSGTHFYKLKLNAYNGNGSYSATKVLDFGAAPSLFSLRPNPFSDQLYIHADQQVKITELTIRAMSGRVMRVYTNISSDTVLQLSDFHNGVYFVHIQTAEGKLEIFKLVKM